jgi:acetyltransferase-like isoleucine patch superfamily enzyme
VLIYKIIRKIKTIYQKYKLNFQNQILLNGLKSKGAIIGSNVKFGRNVTISGGKNIVIGNNVYIGSNAFIRGEGGLYVGNNVIFSRNLVLCTSSHNHKGKFLPFDETYNFKKVIIEDNVWVGTNVTIAPGSHIGEGVIVGLGTNIFKHIPKLSVAVSSQYNLSNERDGAHYQLLKSTNKFSNKDGREI